MRAFFKGLLYGIGFFLPGALIISNWQLVDQVWSGIVQMPVVTQISKDFKTGMEIAGELFSEQADLFYRTDSISILPFKNRKRVKRSKYAWNRQAIEQKLAKEFSSRKMKGAKRFLNYVEQHYALATHEMKISQIPASITLAQGILESDAGDSRLARVARNHFGIKCPERRDKLKDGVIDNKDFYHHELAYDCLQQADDDKWDRFEMYESTEISYRRHTILLTQSKRYNWMFDQYFTGQDYRVERKWFGVEIVPYYAAWAIGLKKSGYATSKRYAQKLAYIIETYELWRIDYEVVLS